MTAFHAERAVAFAAAFAAGEVHRRWLAAGDPGVEAKADGTPVTRADREANEAIVALLAGSFPDDAILAEETVDTRARLARSRVWLVDPLDGTRDFIAGTGEFAVHVALVVDGVPAVAVVYQPVSHRLFHAIAGHGAFERVAGEDRRLAVSPLEATRPPRIGVSRLGVTAGLRRLRAESDLAPGLVELGASLKLVAVACGELEASLALTSFEHEWDTCAPELVIREAGGVVTDLDGNALRYNQPDLRRTRGLLASNGHDHAALLERVRPFFPT